MYMHQTTSIHTFLVSLSSSYSDHDSQSILEASPTVSYLSCPPPPKSV